MKKELPVKGGKLYHMTGGFSVTLAFKPGSSKPWLIICGFHRRRDIGSNTETVNHEGISLLPHYSGLMIEQSSYSVSQRKPSCLERAIDIKTYALARGPSSRVLAGMLLLRAQHVGNVYNSLVSCCWQKIRISERNGWPMITQGHWWDYTVHEVWGACSGQVLQKIKKPWNIRRLEFFWKVNLKLLSENLRSIHLAEGYNYDTNINGSNSGDFFICYDLHVIRVNLVFSSEDSSSRWRACGEISNSSLTLGYGGTR